VVSGDLGRGQPGERVVLQVCDRRAHPGGRRLAGLGQRQPERAAVGGIQFPGQVAAVLQPVEEAGQRAGPGAGPLAELADVQGPALAQVRQRVDLGGRQVQVRQRGAERVQRAMRSPLQRQHHVR
jgi:hypothetical protein